ncbi:MAG: signal peptidase II [Alphaproteobacteria bacterium]|nr:MAG: signal peptidase II [Alphaproteobacteria bacterium]
MSIPMRIAMIVTLFIGFGIDQYTKYVVQKMEIATLQITPFFAIKGVVNAGVSFGMFADFSPLTLVVLTSCIVVVFAFIFWRETRSLSAWSYVCVLSGALSNIADRVRMGGVFDFFDFHLGGYHFPTFNVADALITLGAVGLLIDSLRFCPKSRKR